MNDELKAPLTRRELLTACLIAGGTRLAGFDILTQLEIPDADARDAFQEGKRLSLVNFVGEPQVPVNVPFGAELDGRLVTDLSDLTPEKAVTPSERFYVRTRASQLLDHSKPWVIRISGLVGQPVAVTLERLKNMTRPCGLHLMECAGNDRSVRFGLLGAARWAGVPITEVLAAAEIKSQACRVLVSGFDRYVAPSVTSVPGASWIFTLDDLKAAKAFLATSINGEPLPEDHGAPVRLLVPGWYGCACIKWVNEIVFVKDDIDATSQMQEYATRTNQAGVPILARDYKAALIEQSAMPIRVEKWRVQGRTRYRVVGILWGGSRPVNALEIRFNPNENYSPVDSFQPSGNDSWSFWTHTWQPQRPGRYLIQLRVKDPMVPASRMNSGHYVRSVEIHEV
jgi:DMSO/TMAO reductase YedYZ molybdopterin-dependent catalytic subunit